MQLSYVIIPILAALFGWICMTLAIRWILYRYLPTQKSALAFAAGDFIQKQLLDSPVLAEKLAGPETIDSILPFIETEIDHFLRVRLKESMPVVGMFIGDKTIGQLKAVFMEELVRLFPKIMGQLAEQLPQKLNISQLILEKMNPMTPAQWNSFMHSTIGPKAKQLGLLGAILGLLTSLFSLGMLALLG